MQRIQSDEYSVNFKQIGAKIDADFGLDYLMENFLNDVTRSALHSYTHSGLLQLGRRFDGNDVKPNYKDDEIVEVVRVTTSAVFMVTSLVTKHFGFEEDSHMADFAHSRGQFTRHPCSTPDFAQDAVMGRGLPNGFETEWPLARMVGRRAAPLFHIAHLAPPPAGSGLRLQRLAQKHLVSGSVIKCLSVLCRQWSEN